MKPIFQTRFGGKNAPDDEKGNCWQAALASVLELPLEETLDISLLSDEYDDHWQDEVNEWLVPFGLATIYVTQEHGSVTSALLGYHLAEVRAWSGSALAPVDEKHVVVIKDGYVVHDPANQEVQTYDVLGVYLVVTLDASNRALIRTEVTV